MNDAELRAHAVAAEQYGVLDRSQARRAGLSDRQIDVRIANDRWEPVLPTVYRVRGAPVTTRQRMQAATLWAGPSGAISHVAAGRLLRLDAVPTPKTIDVSVGSPKQLRAHGMTVHRTRLDMVDRTTVDGIPCTTATRTLIDLAATLDAERLETAFDHARRLGLTSVGAFEHRAAALCGRGRSGSGTVRQLLAAVTPRPSDSRLEVRLARLLRAHGIEPSESQHPLGRFRVDHAWPLLKVAVECDGFEHHGRRLVWKRDRRRIAWLETQGWRIVHVTWDDVTQHPEQAIDRIRIALRQAA